MKNASPKEHNEQVALVRKLRKDGYFVVALPNGGLRDAITAKRLRDEGVTAGAPDLIVIHEGGVLWVELKRRSGGVVSKSQRAFHLRLEELGHDVLVGMGAKDAYDKVLDYFKNRC